jgi:DNA-binding CsgD family transcriptional regulator
MFSKAEKTVVKLVLTGLSNKEIADRLSLKEKTL